jgi:hypothetical protein
MSRAIDPEVAEEKQSLLLLTYAPAVWLAYFIVCYAAGAIWCGPDPARDHALGAVRLGIIAAGVIAMLAIGITARQGWRRFSYGEGDRTRDDDTPEDRHRFLGFATVLLSGLSAVATLYVALTAVFVHNCR